MSMGNLSFDGYSLAYGQWNVAGARANMAQQIERDIARGKLRRDREFGMQMAEQAGEAGDARSADQWLDWVIALDE